MSPLDDGTYDGLVVDVVDDTDGATRLEIAVTSGEHKGSVVNVRGRASIDVLGLPVVLVVEGDAIRVRFERG